MNKKRQKKAKYLPVTEKFGKKFVPSIIAVMTFLGTLILGCFFILNNSLLDWKKGVQGSLTIQVPPIEEVKDGQTKIQYEKSIDEIFTILSQTQGIEQVRVVDDQTLLGLLEPWLGKQDSLNNLPIPRLIEVIVSSDNSLKLDLLQQDLIAINSDITVQDHQKFIQPIFEFVESLQLLAITILGLILLSMMGVIIFTTRTSLAIHNDVIEVLHMVGANDHYIARQFDRQAFRYAFIGGLLGVSGAICLLLVFLLSFHMSQNDNQSLSVLLNIWQWIVILMTPFFISAIAMMSAHLSVRKSLKQII